MLNPLDIISHYYDEGGKAWEILVTHSRCVADLAVRIAEAHPELGADISFVREAAMLHDIGICKTSAPSIYCFGDADYICHGILGSEMLRSEGLDRHALVAERHTGSGISKEYIAANGLPLPLKDFFPVSIEEQVVCYADKFFSKSKNLTEQKSWERALRSVSKFGEESRLRFLEMDSKLRIEGIV